MATVTITNTQAQPANRGQGVLVTALNNNNFDNIKVGQKCELDSNSKVGTVVWVDSFNGQMKIAPQYNYSTLASYSNSNLFSSNEEVIVTIS